MDWWSYPIGKRWDAINRCNNGRSNVTKRFGCRFKLRADGRLKHLKTVVSNHWKPAHQLRKLRSRRRQHRFRDYVNILRIYFCIIFEIEKWNLNVLRTVNAHSQGDRALFTGGGFFFIASTIDTLPQRPHNRGSSKRRGIIGFWCVQ